MFPTPVALVSMEERIIREHGFEGTHLGKPACSPGKLSSFFPAFSSQEATAPLGILAVSTPLLRAGYQVRIIDSTITPNFQKRVLEELKDALCLAVSLVTGPMIKETVQIARAAKAAVSRQAGRFWAAGILRCCRDQTLGAPITSTSWSRGRAKTRCSKSCSASKRANRWRALRASATKKTAGFVFNPAASAEADSRDAAEGVSSGGFRCV